ncbi:MAG: hypothetical protein OEM62_05310 [Acidobacteriota bacterium]|nr:hypothetical protein [Acidobacteriota bacterium]
MMKHGREINDTANLAAIAVVDARDWGARPTSAPRTPVSVEP